MSIEKALAELTAAVQENTKAIQAMGQAAPAGAAKKETKPEPKAETKKAEVKEDPKKETKPEPKAETKKADDPSEADLIEAFTKYLPKDLDKDERAKRAPKVKNYLEEQGAKRATDLKPEQRAAAIEFVEGLIAELEDAGSDDDMI